MMNVTDESVERALPVFKLYCHEQPRVRSEKYDAFDREAVKAILEAAQPGKGDS